MAVPVPGSRHLDRCAPSSRYTPPNSASHQVIRDGTARFDLVTRLDRATPAEVETLRSEASQGGLTAYT